MQIFFAVLLLAISSQNSDAVKVHTVNPAVPHELTVPERVTPSDRQKPKAQEPPRQIANSPQVNCRQNDPMCFIETAKRLAERGEQLDLALACAQWALAIPPVPNDGIWRQGFFLTVGYVQIRRREFDQAVATLLQGAQRTPAYSRDDQYLNYLALAYEGSGRIDEAIDAYITLAGGLRDVSAAPTERLVELYRKRFGSLAGLEEKIEANRQKARRVFYVERELLEIPAPAWSLRDLDGKQVSLADFSGRILVLSFLSAGGNIHELTLKFLQAQYEKYRDKGIAFICIDYTGNSYVQEFKTSLRQMGVTIPMLIADSTVVKDYGAIVEPLVVLIDKKGTIRFKNTTWHDYGPYVTNQIEFLLQTKPN